MYNFYYPHDDLIYHKVCLISDENCEKSVVLKFLLLCGPMLTKTKKKNI